jgi:hypothetical protein
VGDRPTFDQDHAELHVLATAGRDWLLEALAMMWDGMVALMEGRLDEVEPALDRILEAGSDEPNLVYSYGGQLFLLRREQARLGEVVTLFEDLARSNEQLLVARALLSVAYCDLGRLEEAHAIVRALGQNGYNDLAHDLTWSTVLALLAELSWRLRDRESAAALEPLCAPFGGQLVIVAWGVGCLGAMDRYRAMLAVTCGDAALAHERFAAAVALEEQVGATVAVARTRTAWAKSLLSTDEAQAARLLEDASVTADKLGLDGLRAELASARSRPAPG